MKLDEINEYTWRVRVVVTNADKVLLVKSKKTHVWGLPGGGIEHESPLETARRETHEETSLNVQITRLVGYSHFPRWFDSDMHTIVFAGIPVDSTQHPIPGKKDEIMDTRYFSFDNFPSPFFWWQKQFIQQAMNGNKENVIWRQEIWPFDTPISRYDVAEMVKKSGLSKSDFFIEHFLEGRSRLVVEIF